MPVMAFHSTADPSVFYDEPSASAFPNTGPTGAATLPPAVHFWMSSAACKTISASAITATTTRDTGAGCTTDVVFYSTNGGSHAWPVTGAGFDYSASPLIVDFFKAHALP
jgi:poly(3-hydroxybutyrate) depolymerase